MGRYTVDNKWGWSAWNPAGTFIIGSRPDQDVVSLKISSSDGGATLTGDMTYSGEGPIKFEGKKMGKSNTYLVKNQWGTSGQWHDGGKWVLGGRVNQSVISVKIESSDGGKTLVGSMTYSGEGPIDFKGTKASGLTFSVENEWANTWNNAGIWALGDRDGQNLIGLNVTSSDDGGSMAGTMQYKNEGPIEFRGTLTSANNYNCEQKWGSSPWHDAGKWLIGDRAGQSVVEINVKSSDGGKTLTGDMKYSGEGPIGFKGVIA